MDEKRARAPFHAGVAARTMRCRKLGGAIKEDSYGRYQSTAGHAPTTFRQLSASDVGEVARWEAALVADIRQARLAGLSSPAEDGHALLGQLIADARRSNLTRTMRYTLLALLCGAGEERTRSILDSHFTESPPEPFAAVEADAFAKFMRRQASVMPAWRWLEEIVAFEHALVRATLYGEASVLTWSTDPAWLLESLDKGKLPPAPPMNRVFMRVEATAAGSSRV